MTPITEEKLKEYLTLFQVKEENYCLKPITNSHINDTYRVEDEKGEGRYIFQRINHNVFHKPEQVMDNIVMVTEHIKKKIAATDNPDERQVLSVVPARGNGSYIETGEGFFRVYKFIRDAYSCDHVTRDEEFVQVAAAIGHFHSLLSDFDGSRLHITIPDFHNTPKRLEGFKKAVEEDAFGRAAGVQEEIRFILNREPLARAYEGKGGLKLRVTHNDTKPSNVMLDKKTGRGLCMIDLDTVMPGIICDDFGDAIRSGTCKIRENGLEGYQGDYFDSHLYEVFHKAFLQECGEMLTKTEQELLPVGAMKITYEQALRFLEDYLKGDVYYKVAYARQNLQRAKIQMNLLMEMETYLQEK